jgi:hypothetical protein
MSKPFGVIYLTMNLLNGKTYIGQTRREGLELDKYFGSGTIILKALKKYGKENFKKIILSEAESEKELNDLEKLFIKELHPHYNLAKGGEGGDTFSGRSEESKDITRKLCSEASSKFFREKGFTVESRKKISVGRIAWLKEHGVPTQTIEGTKRSLKERPHWTKMKTSEELEDSRKRQSETQKKRIAELPPGTMNSFWKEKTPEEMRLTGEKRSATRAQNEALLTPEEKAGRGWKHLTSEKRAQRGENIRLGRLSKKASLTEEEKAERHQRASASCSKGQKIRVSKMTEEERKKQFGHPGPQKSPYEGKTPEEIEIIRKRFSDAQVKKFAEESPEAMRARVDKANKTKAENPYHFSEERRKQQSETLKALSNTPDGRAKKSSAAQAFWDKKRFEQDMVEARPRLLKMIQESREKFSA